MRTERYGKWESVATRFYRWQKAGIWNQILEHLQADADKQGKLDWEVHYVDGTVIRAHGVLHVKNLAAFV
ncbi:transposase [Scytonema tolypothrichoides VB-61278]|nr:transposase [Scytonema tolypothrichoides VB-61278]